MGQKYWVVLLALTIPGPSQSQSSCPLVTPDACLGICEGGSGDPADPCLYCDTGCHAGWERLGNCCCPPTPVILDTDGNDFEMTGLRGGVRFDMTGDEQKEQVSWTARGASAAFLVLDRNGNGEIDHAVELFGNLSPQPAPPPGARRNGFLALAVYDSSARGGNEDGVITNADEAFGYLRLWHDRNHNGRTDPGELSTLAQWDIAGIELDYKLSRRTDEHGNRFRYRAKVIRGRGPGVARWAWDVLLQVAQTPRGSE